MQTVNDRNPKHRHAKRAGVIFSIDWVGWFISWVELFVHGASLTT